MIEKKQYKRKTVDNKKTEKSNIYKAGRILDINRREINATIRKKKTMLLAGLLIMSLSFLAGFLSNSGPPGYHYGGVSMKDFLEIWRFY